MKRWMLLLGRGFEFSDFERARKKKIGGYLRMLNSPENIAHEFTREQFRGVMISSICFRFMNRLHWKM